MRLTQSGPAWMVEADDYASTCNIKAFQVESQGDTIDQRRLIKWLIERSRSCHFQQYGRRYRTKFTRYDKAGVLPVGV